MDFTNEIKDLAPILEATSSKNTSTNQDIMKDSESATLSGARFWASQNGENKSQKKPLSCPLTTGP
ncbi:hypothetical protein [Massilia sp. erpn]|uniref:hypothetical protein n=1 Tax=Massilia sp. erpn TaxID=2738142 RepID=UPI00210455F3|nr:hypothetical protein [Massilia sp. erpn]UTY56283.1 hypothetical protein HPQ68_03200 [Massilia sp. erpn]